MKKVLEKFPRVFSANKLVPGPAFWLVAFLGVAPSFGAAPMNGTAMSMAMADEGRPAGARVPSRNVPFTIGVCVGQTLTQQGIVIAIPQRGQPAPSLDSVTQTALRDAIHSCRANYEGESAGRPSSVPSPVTSGTPSPTPSPTT